MTNLHDSTEVWKDIPGYEGFYQASTLGNLKCLPRLIKSSRGEGYQLHSGGLIIPLLEKSGYKAVSLSILGKVKRIRVHTLVARTFCQNPEGHTEVNHINGIKHDNRPENLEWCSRSHNGKHMYATGLAKPVRNYGCTNDPVRSRKVDQFDMSGNFIKSWPSLAQIKRELGFHKSLITYCVTGKFKQAYGFVWKAA